MIYDYNFIQIFNPYYGEYVKISGEPKNKIVYHALDVGKEVLKKLLSKRFWPFKTTSEVIIS